MSGIFNSFLFNNTIFNTGDAGVVIKTGTGGIDPEKKRRTIYKPTGLLARKPEGQKGVEQRIDESKQIQREVFEEVIASKLQVDLKPIQSMTSAEVDREIGILMREKVLAEEEDEMMMLMMMIAND